MCWAYGSFSSSTVIREHSHFGPFNLQLELTSSNNTEDITNAEGSSVFVDKTDMEMIHGWVSWSAWTILGFIQIASNRFLRKFWRVHMWIHIISGMLILILTTYACAALIKDKGEIETDVHSIIGLIFFALTFLVVLIGFIAR